MIPPKIISAFSPEMFTHLEASSNYTILNLKGGEKLISGYSLKVFEDFFQYPIFIRVDRSNLVNRTFIACVSERKGGMYIHLKNHTQFLIPRRRKATLQNQYPNLFPHHQTSLLT